MEIDFTVIIPQRNSISTLPRLFDSIPVSDKIEIIVVDNTPTPITKEDIGVDRDYQLLWSAPERHAGGARNVGIENAHGKWLVFADADDYFTKDAFDVFYNCLDSDSDVVYFGMTGIYEDTGEYSDRGEHYTKMVRDYLSGAIPEKSIRVEFSSPCSKMVRKALVDKYHIRFDEVRAANDAFFSTKAGFYANKIDAVDHDIYVATVNKGTLTKRRDYEVIHSRYLVKLRRNQFLRQNGLKEYQAPVMFYFYQSRSFGIKILAQMFIEAIKYRQNIFKGCSHWTGTMKIVKKKEKDDSKYILK